MTPSLKAFLVSIILAMFFVILPIVLILIIVSVTDKIIRSKSDSES